MNNNSSVPRISVIIRTKNEKRFIGKALKAVFEQEIELPFEVIVIDSGSTDGTLQVVRSFNTRLYEVSAGSFTYGSALNYGARLAMGEYVINLSHDCIPVTKKWMGHLINPLVKNPEVAACLGKQVPIKGINPYEEQALNSHFFPAEAGRPREVFSNANCAIRKNVLELHPFDEKTTFAEDFLWAHKLPSEYKIAYAKEAEVYHSHPLSKEYWSKRYYNYGLFVPYLKKHYGLDWPVGSNHPIKRHGILKSAFTEITSYIRENIYAATFLIHNRYYRYIIILPFFVLLRRYYYKKGIQDGLKLYGANEGQQEAM